MKTPQEAYAQQIGGKYGVVACLLGITLFLLMVEFIGVIFGYHPIALLSDIVYIFNRAFYLGIACSVILSYFVGRKAGSLVVIQGKDEESVGKVASWLVLFASIVVSVLISASQTTATSAASFHPVSGLIDSCAVLFALGMGPAWWVRRMVWEKAKTKPNPK